ncbi:teichoic acids export ABC transporter ATP-binding subunit TagH [Bacillus sp. FJAT-49732]|uniref:Teichoic acids export ABC transporter ATP-binding subunit TagH n=1 Tax=Lederbergia citrisecunda TaxID=2833583 RepID=A0A942YME9_9BACI|nr:teichoic acids export ABC transporter ATP-binding subunit TagH [Lederbergia citrisecunda]MBS4200630.1 teichoic acids export ABC transporter ATP-binding subunit TagH [Lederbergia citrisecunda]
MKPKVKAENVSKTYQLYRKQSDKMKDIFFPKKKNNQRTFYALKNVSFEIFEGETVGIIGINGSGKSTISNILAEVIPPTSGKIEINGETSLIAISAGLNNQLSGLENIELKCLMLGLKKELIKELTPKIIEFADIGQFIEQPVKNYSSGMKSRLGFAISAYTNPDILIVDEALSVGDKTFYQKCVDKIDEFKKSNKTIIFISHSGSQMRSICDRVIWLHYGQVEEFGKANEVLDKYEGFINWFNKLSKKEKEQYKQDKLYERSKGDQLLNNKRRRKSKSNNNIFTGFLAQITLLVIITMLSAFFMFVENTTSASNNGNRENNNDQGQSVEVEKKAKELTNVKEINREGIVQSRSATIYTNKDLKKEIESIEFTTPIFVENQIDDIYEVQYNNRNAYIKKEQISFIDKISPVSDLKLKDFFPLFPQTIQSSYEFFLAQLSSDYVTVKGKLNGLTDETEEYGHKYLHYDLYDVVYKFNNDEIADAIIIKNISENSDVIDDFRSKATLISEDETLFSLSIEGYKVIIDKENKTIIFITV